MVTKSKNQPQNPLILRCHRLIEAFAKADDERDFYLDRQEGFLLYIDLDKTVDELAELEKELKSNAGRYCPIPKMTFYEVKKLMEGFVNEKVYDIDTKEKLLDIIGSKEARENFLEFIYDHHSELEKWQQYYQERFRVRIIEWLRNNHFEFVFEEDVEMPKITVEKLKLHIFEPKAAKDIVAARKILQVKAKTYYSSEALNPRPKRGRPPKQQVKVETEPQFSQDIYLSIPKVSKPFLFAPEYQGTASIFTFSGRFTSEADLLAHKREQLQSLATLEMQNLSQKLATLKSLSSHWLLHSKGPEAKEEEKPKAEKAPTPVPEKAKIVEKTPKVAEKLQKEKKAVKPKEAKPKVVKKALIPKAKPKMRLRPLVKKKVILPQKKKVQAKPVKKSLPLRRLRSSNKK